MVQALQILQGAGTAHDAFDFIGGQAQCAGALEVLQLIAGHTHQQVGRRHAVWLAFAEQVDAGEVGVVAVGGADLLQGSLDLIGQQCGVAHRLSSLRMRLANSCWR